MSRERADHDPRRVERTDALVRDADPTTPRPTATRSFDAARASHALLPRALRRRALVIDCATDRDRYGVDDPVRFRVTVRNRLPVPIRLRTEAPVPWTWAVDGVDRASAVETLPSEAGHVRFARRERKTFEGVWYQRFRVAGDEWVAADAGDHTLSARLLIDDPRLVATTTLRIERE
ncbi:MAG: hypothetical protein ABEI80_06870 [Haloplanus sp.]